MDSENAVKVPKNEMNAEGIVKTPDKMPIPAEAAAPVTDKPVNSGGEAPDKKDITDVISILNELNNISGNKNAIKDIPAELRGVIGFMLEKMVALRDSFADPLFQKVLDDMVDQKEDGQTPSLMVAVARNVPIEELQSLADNENYTEVQGAVDERLSKDKEAKASEESLYANFESSKKNIDDYCKKMGYDEADKEALYVDIAMLRDAFADGLLSETELEQIDKMRNYDKDTGDLRKQIPAEPEKTVLPDKASIASSMSQSSMPKKRAPENSLEAMGAGPSITDITKVGNKRFGK